MERTSALSVAEAAHGLDLPDWIRALAEECDHLGSQRAAAEAIGYSAAVVNQVLKGTYRGDLRKVEDTVRGAFLGETVLCPVLGALTKDRCRENQSLPFAATNRVRVRLHQECPDCPHAKGGGIDD